MGKTRVLKSVVAATLLCSCNVYANDLGTISVESSTIDDTFEHKKDEVSNVSVITNEDVEKINPTSISEVLDKVPGITYSLTGTDSLKVHIRGIDNQMYMGEKPGVAIVIDGVPVQETTGKINVDLDNIESIKVIKGGASYLYGNDAIGGAIVITTKRPKAGTSAKVEAELGTFNSKRFLASINKGFENSSLQLQGSYRDSDGYWDDAYVTVKSVNGKYQYYLTDYSDLTVGLDYTKRKTGDGNSVSGTIEAENNPKSEGYYSYGGYYDSDLTKAYVTYKQDIDQSSDFMVRLHHYKDDKTSKSRRTEYDNEEVWKQNGAKAEYKKSFESFAVMAGVDVQRNETDEASYIAATGALRAEYDTKEDINAIYTELKYAITNNLTSTLNLRYDDIELDYADKMDSTLDVSPSYDATSYRFGLNYKFSQNHLLYTSVSTGFRTPTVG
jgi:iron complex outermembrane receptor protein